MHFATCCVPVSALRKEPFHTVEIISQQLFGECCTVLEAIPGWVKVTAKYDGYEGWCQASHVVEITEEQFSFTQEKLSSGYVGKVIYNGTKMFVPFGSSLSIFTGHKAVWNNIDCVFKGPVYIPSEESAGKKRIRWIAGKYLNTAYLWGGKSVFGIDCSGFTQAVYKFLGIYLPRDSWQQAESGTTVHLLKQAKPGDLCFFDNKEGRIVHVGLLLNTHQVIHSSGKVRIDEIDQTGIINSDTKIRTHALKIIKRYF